MYVLDRPFQKCGSGGGCNKKSRPRPLGRDKENPSEEEEEEEEDCGGGGGDDNKKYVEAMMMDPDLLNAKVVCSKNDRDDNDDDNLTAAAAAAAAAANWSDSLHNRRRRRRPRRSLGQESLKPDVKRLVKECKALNAAEREESFAVQYMALGGLKYFSGTANVVLSNYEKRYAPALAGSLVHAGSGQQTFGFLASHRADLMVAYKRIAKSGCDDDDDDNDTLKPASVVCFHNYHGHMWHYMGHFDDCPQKLTTGGGKLRIHDYTAYCDDFKKGLAQAWSSVRPDRVYFDYSASYACQLFHGTPVSGLDADPLSSSPLFSSTTVAPQFYFSVKECLLKERPLDSWFPPAEKFFEENQLKEGIKSGKISGFVTVRGGSEADSMKFEDPAGTRFGFCVQQYAPTPKQISPFTKDQIKKYLNFSTDAEVENYLKKQQPKTLNSGTFHSEETVSTTYLRWLMLERKFENFEITHFLHYEFRNWSADFLLPVLQRRHEAKKKGNAVAAECLKLIGNGSYGYNGLESCNYDSVILLTQDNLVRKLSTGGSLAATKIKHISLLGLVKVKSLAKKKAKKKKQVKRKDHFWEDFEAKEAATDKDSDDDDDDDNRRDDKSASKNLELEEDDDDDDDKTVRIDFAEQNRWKKNSLGFVLEERIKATPSILTEKKQRPNCFGKGEDEEDLDLEEQLLEEYGELRSSTTDLHLHDHNYSSRSSAKRSDKKISYTYKFLYSVTVSGEDKQIFNCLPKAVAVLSNSKRLFLGHISLMMRCLDPCLAELCYIDTDSCIWSLSRKTLTECLLPEMKSSWTRANILANEDGEASCHGKMKLEGLFSAGKFKSLKIYRLYNSRDSSSSSSSNALRSSAELRPAYTRCKGINRYLADKLPDKGFDSFERSKIVVHRSSLKPTRKGEILMTHDSRSLAVPFNLKRHVTSDGKHSLPFSLV